jgi:hypothetical protein
MLAASGIALLDAGAVIHYFIKIRKKFSVAKLNTRLAQCVQSRTPCPRHALAAHALSPPTHGPQQ